MARQRHRPDELGRLHDGTACDIRTATIGRRDSGNLRERSRRRNVSFVSDTEEPSWLSRLRPAAKQRPRTQFIKIRWHDLQELLRERDSLWQAASDDTRTDLEATRREYGRTSG